jgi:hypothetical protein
MSNQAKSVPGSVEAINSYKDKVDGVFFVIVPCPDYDAFASLPAAIEYEEIVCGKTGWNSDRGEAYYNSKHGFAKAVK